MQKLPVAALLCGGLVLLAGCSSHPDEDQMRQLTNLQDEVASLQKDAASKDQQRATLEREVAEKQAKLKKCQDDQAVVRQRLGR